MCDSADGSRRRATDTDGMEDDEVPEPDADLGGLDPWHVGAAWAVLGLAADSRSASSTPPRDRGSSADASDGPDTAEPGPGRTPLDVLDPAAHRFDGPSDLDAFVGQEQAVAQLQVHVSSAAARGAALDHVLIVSPRRGVGRSTLGYLVAKAAGRRLVHLAPPVTVRMLAEAGDLLGDGEGLLLEDLDRFGDDPAVWQAIRQLMGRATSASRSGGTAVPKLSVLGTAVAVDAVPPAVLDGFAVTARLAPYTTFELTLIAAQMAGRYLANVDDDVLIAIAEHCEGSPSVARRMVLAGRDLAVQLDRSPSVGEFMSFLGVPPPRAPGGV